MFSCLLIFLFLVCFVGQSEGSAPKFVQEPSDIIVQKNKPASLHCVAAGSPKPSVTWWKDGVPLSLSSSGTRRRLLTNGTLYFTTVLHSKISKPDEGQYQCVASSPDQSSIVISRKASLKVAGKKLVRGLNYGYNFEVCQANLALWKLIQNRLKTATSL